MGLRQVATHLCLVIFSVTALFAQGGAGVISGTVTDTSKAPIVAADVNVTNADTNAVAWTGKTNESGIYRAPSLPVGRYDVSVQSQGFKASAVRGVNLSIDQRADINVTLELGQTTETLTVEGSTAGQLATDTSSLGNTITPGQVENLPLPSRNVLNLLVLTPGVSVGSAAASSLNSAQLSINGSRTLNSEFLIDGVSVVSGSTGAPQTLPPADSIREFKVLTSSYSAEYGRTSGGIITLITNSGANEVHGAAYGYLRNEDLDANNFFFNVLGRPRAEDRYNLFGGKFSGPVTIPRLYHGKNKTFFFVNYEGLKQASPFSTTSTVPSAPYTTGNFSTSPIKILNPAANLPFPGNIIPQSLLDPAALKILNAAPAPNSTGSLNANDNVLTNNFVSTGASHPTTNTGVVRIDETVSDKMRLFWTFTHFNNLSPVQPAYPGSVLENAVGNSQTTGYETTLGLTEDFTPTLIGEFRFGFFRNNSEILPPSNGINVPSTLGIQSPFGVAAPVININGYSQLGTNSNTLRTQIDNNFQTAGTVSKSAGNHLIQFGGQLRKNQFDDFNPTSDVNGSYTFDGSITNVSHVAGDPINALADFLLGDIKTGSYSLPQPLIGRRNYNLGLFVQDDWKIRPNLTLNLGLRWEHESPITTANNEYSRVDPTTGTVLFAGKNASNSLNLGSAKLNFGPRIGAAYSLRPTTVIRGGFGIFYSQLFSLLGGQVLFPGYNIEQAFNNLGTGVPQPFKLSQGLPKIATQNIQNPQANIAQFNTPANPLSLSAYGGFTQANPLPYAEEWNLGVQHQIAKGLILDVNYVGSHGVHLPVNLPTNAVPYNPALDTSLALANTTLATQLARPFPTIGGFNSLNMEGSSSYHSLQISARRQFGDNFTFISNYTYSRSIDDSSGIYSFSQPSGLNIGQFPNQFLGLNKGLSEFDRPHIFTTAILYKTKGNIFARNFEFYPILNVRSGIPLYIGQTNTNPAATGTSQMRPNLVNPNVSLYTTETPSGTGIQYLLPVNSPNFPLAPVGPYFVGTGSARTQVLPASIGTLGRNVVRGPGELNLDLSVGRQFDVTERVKIHIRAEAYNILNHTNFQNPNSTLSVTANAQGQAIFNSPNYGLITVANPARFLQMVLRVQF